MMRLPAEYPASGRPELALYLFGGQPILMSMTSTPASGHPMLLLRPQQTLYTYLQDGARRADDLNSLRLRGGSAATMSGAQTRAFHWRPFRHNRAGRAESERLAAHRPSVVPT